MPLPLAARAPAAASNSREVVEIARPAVRPADPTAFGPRQPSANERLPRVPGARSTRRAVELAGGQGCAGTAATAETDVDIQRYSSSSATLRFAVAADPATFAAADETALEPAGALAA